MTAYLSLSEWRDFDLLLRTQDLADPIPFTVDPMLNVEMNVRTFAARHYGRRPGYQESWKP